MTTAAKTWRNPTVVLICGGLILTLALGLRHPMGLFLKPMVFDLHWNRETFSIALALANLVWAPSSRSPAPLPIGLARGECWRSAAHSMRRRCS